MYQIEQIMNNSLQTYTRLTDTTLAFAEGVGAFLKILRNKQTVSEIYTNHLLKGFNMFAIFFVNSAFQNAE